MGRMFLNISTFLSPIYTFSLAGYIIVYMPSQGTNREKNFKCVNYREKLPNLAGNKQLSIDFFPHR